jgi:hypothetical protein
MPTRRQAARFAPYFKLPLTFALTYGGGSIQPSPKVYVVFWGKIWQNRIGDPDGVGRYLKDFLKALNGSQWLSTVTQYYGPPGTYITNTTSLQGTYIDSTSELPPQPSDEIIRYEAYLAAAHFGDYSGDASYVVAMPHGHDPPWFGFGLCAYHASLSNAGPSGQPIAYTALPYMPDTGKACGAGSVNNPGTLDGVSIIEGHEQAETETDPQPFTGWSGANHFELADPCDWHNLQNTQFGRKTFPTQPLWSNVDNGCVQ